MNPHQTFAIILSFCLGAFCMTMFGWAFEFLTATDACLSLSNTVESMAQGFFMMQLP